MSTAPSCCPDGRGPLHVRVSVANRRHQVPWVVVYCIGAIAILASVGRTMTTKEVHEVAVQRAKAWAAKNYVKADALQKILLNAGYRQVPDEGDEQVLVKKYRIRLSGIDAPESSMPYGKEAKEELVRLVQGKVLKIHVYDRDRYGRLVGDVDCNGVLVQEHMLKKGLALHYTAYDHRIELNKWEDQAKTSRTGLWALPKPEKPWEWRKKNIGAV